MLKPVAFYSEGVKLAGDLFLPADIKRAARRTHAAAAPPSSVMNSSLQSGAENVMSIRIGYLLPTRERIMAGQPQAAPLLELAERAERLGFDSVWVGDSLLARPRHEPLTLLAAVASRVRA
jgi:hypothetical protein